MNHMANDTWLVGFIFECIILTKIFENSLTVYSVAKNGILPSEEKTRKRRIVMRTVVLILILLNIAYAFFRSLEFFTTNELSDKD